MAEAAATDHDNIIAWTSQQFGLRQARSYARTLSLALQYLAGGPSQVGIRARPEIGDDLLTLHVAGSGRPGRHLLLLRYQPGGLVMEVLRILHDSMDLPLHSPD